ncbi:hypothetical protein Pmani_006324 [Petrolisthes manimaculis]|uniref:Uncharacterized protein n=1 Tax=Petrolisthes manimaculis TaxID=1843537 RepID=A0AAE1UFS8_9EUCA|nr:hypothetical protein Pmani_006324 [Petrolisthes manimaculis]
MSTSHEADNPTTSNATTAVNTTTTSLGMIAEAVNPVITTTTNSLEVVESGNSTTTTNSNTNTNSGDPIAKNKPPHFRMVTDCVRHKRLRQDIGR